MIRILLDEDIPLKLRHHFSAENLVETVQYRGWKGVVNGDLLRLAEREFDVLITLDDNLPEQQNLSGFALALIVLRPGTW